MRESASSSPSTTSGPPDLEKAEIWTRAYADIAAEYSFPDTFFTHPEVAVAQANLFRELESNGCSSPLELVHC
jgi:hypothetical protein